MKAVTEKDVLARLDSLPESLDAYYDVTWHRITAKDNDPRSVEYAKAILMWVTHTTRPLYIDEMQQAIGVMCSSGDLESCAITADELKQLCGGFIALRRDFGPYFSRTIQLIHFSTKEYFDRRNYFPCAEKRMSQACVETFPEWLTKSLLRQQRFWRKEYWEQEAWAWHTLSQEKLGQMTSLPSL